VKNKKALHKNSIDSKFSRHANLVSASLRFNEVLKQVQDDGMLYLFFVNGFYQCFALTEPIKKPLFSGSGFFIFVSKHYAFWSMTI